MSLIDDDTIAFGEEDNVKANKLSWVYWFIVYSLQHVEFFNVKYFLLQASLCDAMSFSFSLCGSRSLFIWLDIQQQLHCNFCRRYFTIILWFLDSQKHHRLAFHHSYVFLHMPSLILLLTILFHFRKNNGWTEMVELYRRWRQISLGVRIQKGSFCLKFYISVVSVWSVIDLRGCFWI